MIKTLLKQFPAIEDSLADETVVNSSSSVKLLFQTKNDRVSFGFQGGFPIPKADW